MLNMKPWLRVVRSATYKTVRAVDLWRKMLSACCMKQVIPGSHSRTPATLRSPQQHVGVVHSSNLCTEITLNTSDDEIAVCNLGSVNLAQHIDENGLDMEKLSKDHYYRICVCWIMSLTTTITVSHRHVVPICDTVLLAWASWVFRMPCIKHVQPYASEEAIEFADRSMEAVSYFAIQASSALAEERGCLSQF